MTLNFTKAIKKKINLILSHAHDKIKNDEAIYFVFYKTTKKWHKTNSIISLERYEIEKFVEENLENCALLKIGAKWNEVEILGEPEKFNLTPISFIVAPENCYRVNE